MSPTDGPHCVKYANNKGADQSAHPRSLISTFLFRCLDSVFGIKVGLNGSYKINKSTLYEPWHEISNNVVCATSKASDQPAQTRSLIRAFASRLNII